MEYAGNSWHPDPRTPMPGWAEYNPMLYWEAHNHCIPPLQGRILFPPDHLEFLLISLHEELRLHQL